MDRVELITPGLAVQYVNHSTTDLTRANNQEIMDNRITISSEAAIIKTDNGRTVTYYFFRSQHYARSHVGLFGIKVANASITVPQFRYKENNKSTI